ncbi:MAG: hypothetical protein KF812_10270 [Fimbriimonadaceae bacterium]|nr:hypothetical protein [Fimbriimonadaceae bacterium]
MNKLKSNKHPKRSATELALRQAKLSSNSMIRAEDIKGATPAAATKALARLAKQGVLIRVGKGLYYAPKDTLLGKSRPSEMAIAIKTLEGKTRPTGASAANLLGLSTQLPARPQLVAFTSNKPKNTGVARLRLRRGSRPHPLPTLEGALLEFIRERGKSAETNAVESYRRLKCLLKEQLQMDRLRELREVALEEPPRVRAMLGAIFAYAELPQGLWEPLKASLNPLTKFDFGLFSELPNAQEWQAK